MRVFLLGATGTIGTAILKELLGTGHDVTALCRSQRRAATVAKLGATPLAGDLCDPDGWADALQDQEAVIHAAATFDNNMATADLGVVRILLKQAEKRATPLRVVYTGGCWLYGDTGGTLATEADRFAPIPAFAWMVDHARRLLASPALSTAVLHPAMVYHAEGGVLEQMLRQVRTQRPIEIWGKASTRWPLIHRDDLAWAYRLLLELQGLTGHYNAVAQTGVPVAEIAGTLARSHGQTTPYVCRSRAEVLASEGAWAEGPMLDQRLSAKRLAQATGWAPRYTDLRQCFPPA